MRMLVHICCGPCAGTVLQRLHDAGHELAGFFFNPNIHPLAEYLRRREGAVDVAARLGVPLICADALPEEEQRWTDPWLTDEPHNSPTVAPETAPAPVPPLPLSSPVSPAASVTPEARAPAGGNTRPPLPGLPPAVNPAPWLRAVAGREGERCAFCLRIRLRKTAQAARAHGFDAFTSSLLYSRYQPHALIRTLGEEAAAEAGTTFTYDDFRTSWQRGIALSKEWGVYRQQYCGCVFSEYERYSRDFEKARQIPPRGEV